MGGSIEAGVIDALVGIRNKTADLSLPVCLYDLSPLSSFPLLPIIRNYRNYSIVWQSLEQVNKISQLKRSV